MTNVIRFIGDVHAKFDKYVELTGVPHPTIQVGDFGIGFKPNPLEQIDPLKDRFIRGNHDWPAECKRQPNYIGDGTFEDGIFFIGGAYSIDRAWRTEGLDWWPDEELSYQELDAQIDRFVELKPNIVVSHDVPAPAFHYVLGHHGEMSRTANALTAMFHFHKPKLWIFGHHHKHFEGTYDGCKFICLPELAYLDVNILDYKE